MQEVYYQDISSSKIIRQLSKPIETCKWCMFPVIVVPWSKSAANKLPSPFDWDAGTEDRQSM
jgi:hypothetical protein